jgi:transcriptional regulator of acetoin/glycerol metabolism
MPSTHHALQPRPLASQLIASSWQRCRQQGLASHLHVQQGVLPTRDLRLHQERSQQLRRLALREMHLLEHVLADAGRVMLLADANGVILDLQGDNTFLGRARSVSLTPGASWREQVAGTNAIGTAIVENRFVQILGAQHFFDENRFLACSAMPIHSPEGALAGVLDISGSAHRSSAPAARLVRHAVSHIEHRWVEESATDLLVHLHQHPSWLGTPDEGILTFEDELLTGANTRALAFLGLSPSAIHRAVWRQIFHQRPQLGSQELHRVAGPGLFYANLVRAPKASARFSAAESPHIRPANLEDVKDEALREAIAAENGNISAAARKLGIHRATVYRRLNK